MVNVSTRVSGLDALAEMFRKSSEENRPAYLPYFPIGYPNHEASIEAIQMMADMGVDGFEIGIPFSDPLADGPTVQAATQIALQNGTTVRKCLEAVATLRERGVTQPMLMMGYANPLIAYGIERFIVDAKQAGADGIIVPDVPPDEAQEFSEACKRHDMAHVFLLAPTSTDARIELINSYASGFIYVVSLTGITGARKQLPEHLRQFIDHVRAHTNKPLVLGFGISTGQHAENLIGLVDGFIVGSALVHAGGEGIQAVEQLTSEMLNAVKK